VSRLTAFIAFDMLAQHATDRRDAPFADRRHALEQFLKGADSPDPGEGTGLDECCSVALLVRERLARDALTAVPKTSGSSGLHL